MSVANVSVQMPVALHDALKKLATVNQRTVSGEMRYALERHIAASKQGPSA
jgi:predicted DNA-binding protein